MVLTPGPLLTGVGIYMDGQDRQDGSLGRGVGGTNSPGFRPRIGVRDMLVPE